MKKLWMKIKLTYLYIRFLFAPEQTERIFKIADIVSQWKDSPIHAMVEALILRQQKFNEMYQAGYLPQVPSQAELKNMPEGSFGHELYKHLSQNNIDIALFPHIDIQSRINYLTQRVYLEHDLWHVLLGCDISLQAELELQGFNMAQFHSGINAMLISGGILNTLIKNPADLPATFDRIVQGYQKGKQAKFLLGENVYEKLARPLEEVRTELQLASA